MLTNCCWRIHQYFVLVHAHVVMFATVLSSETCHASVTETDTRVTAAHDTTSKSFGRFLLGTGLLFVNNISACSEKSGISIEEATGPASVGARAASTSSSCPGGTNFPLPFLPRQLGHPFFKKSLLATHVEHRYTLQNSRFTVKKFRGQKYVYGLRHSAKQTVQV